MKRIRGVEGFVLGVVMAMGAQADEFVKMSSGDDYAPYVSTTRPDGGLITALVRQILQKAGYALQLQIKPWKRGYVDGKSGLDVATFPYYRNADREKDFYPPCRKISTSSGRRCKAMAGVSQP